MSLSFPCSPSSTAQALIVSVLSFLPPVAVDTARWALWGLSPAYMQAVSWDAYLGVEYLVVLVRSQMSVADTTLPRGFLCALYFCPVLGNDKLLTFSSLLNEVSLCTCLRFTNCDAVCVVFTGHLDFPYRLTLPALVSVPMDFFIF